MDLIPWLPQAASLALARHGLWALVLGGAACWLLRGRSRPMQLSVLALALLCTALPGSLSVSYWLGLAFKAPSLVSAALGLVAVVLTLWPRLRQRLTPAEPGGGSPWPWLRGLAVALGWLLLADMLALLPMSLYAWGFGTPALALALLVLLLLGWRWGAVPAVQPGLLLAGAILLLFVLTRWPSGNLWDALLDPLLWLGLQVRWLHSLRTSARARSVHTA